MRLILINDTTLRDGEQTAGVVFVTAEKIQIAKLLSEIGVYQIEAGIPAMGGDEVVAVKAIAALDLPCSIMAWNRPVLDDIKKSFECGVDAIAISIPSSDIQINAKLRKTRAWVLETLTRAIDFAKARELYVSVSAEDASRSDFDFLVEFTLAAQQAGADRIRYCDTLGILDPLRTYRDITQLSSLTDIDIEMHTHNDFGMATANALAGLQAGARFVSTTVNGLGERAGNSALEEIVMALKCIQGEDIGIETTRLREIGEYVARAANRAISPGKPIIGSNVFAHESGIHVDGVIKDPRNYEPYSPDEVGLVRQLIVGKHSGSATLVHKFKQFGIDLPEEEAQQMLVEVRSLAIQLKRPLLDEELIRLHSEKHQSVKV